MADPNESGLSKSVEIGGISDKLDSMKLSKSKLTFTDLPMDALYECFKQLDYLERMPLRKVCRKFKNAVDGMDPGFKKIRICIYEPEAFDVEFDSNLFYFVKESGNATHYSKFNPRKMLKWKFGNGEDSLEVVMKFVTKMMSESPESEVGDFPNLSRRILCAL